MKPPANRIRELRKARRWSQEKLATMAGLKSIGHLSNLETGKKASAAACMQIARALDVPVEELGVDFSMNPADGNATICQSGPHYRLPVRARVVGGQADEAIEYQDSPFDWEWSDEGPRDRCEIIEIFGDSMEPLFMAGDRLVVRFDEPPINGDVVVAEYVQDMDTPRQMTVKVFRRKGDVVSLEPLNRKKYRTVIMDDHWRVVAVMIKHIRRNVRGYHDRPQP